MYMDKTRLRVVKLWRNGNHSLASLARKIGRPGAEGMKRIKEILLEENLIEEGNNV